MASSRKREVWLEEYLTTWNATEAARRAGYAHPRQEGARLLSDAVIQGEIKARLTEKTLSADEVLVRLGEQARGDIGDFLDEAGRLDIEKARQTKKTGLIKKLKTKSTTRVIGDKEIATTEVELELYDAQAALVHIGRHHKLFTDKVDLGGELEFKQNESALESVISRLSGVAARIRTETPAARDSANEEGAAGA